MARKVLVVFLSVLINSVLLGQSFTVLTWNIQDLGRSKDAEELAIMAEVMKDYDLIAVQEVVAKDPAGARAIATLADLLNRKGSKWDYRVSDPTQSPTPQHSERYAFLWKTARLELVGRPHLDEALVEYCFREPYIAEFRQKGQTESFYVVNFHSRKHDDHPEEEIRYFDQYPRRLATDRVLILGDFNLDDEHPVWDDLEALGFAPVIQQLPTTLKQTCNAANYYFNYPIDNIFYSTRAFVRQDAGRVDFVRRCEDLERLRGVSDHLPVWVELASQN